MTNLCSLAWAGFYNEANGIAKPCCLFQGKITKDDGSPYYLQTSTVEEIFNSNYMKDLRQRFQDSGDIPECNTCWQDEANGYRSKRELYLKSETQMVEQFGVSFDQIDNIIPSDYQLIISNACNLACKTCSPSHSSLWQGINKKVIGITDYAMPYSQVSSQGSRFWEERKTWLPSIANLEMVGGEPFYISKWEQLVDELIDIGRAKEISINFSSNLTIYNEELLLKLLNNFKIVSMSFSIDGLNGVQEYIRDPITWEQTVDNLTKYQNLLNKKYPAQVITQICHTISWYNILFIPEFINYMNENAKDIPIWLNLVHYPEHLAIPNAPQAVKDLANKRIQDLINNDTRYKQELNSLISFMNSKSPSQNSIDQTIKFIDTQDKARNVYLVDKIPELYRLIFQ
jgi:Radical SAM superfamily